MSSWAMRDPIQELARVKHRDWSLLVGLVDPRLSVFRCRHVETGIVRHFSEEERAAQADPDVWKVEGQVPLESGLTGAQALQYGLLTGQAERLEEVVQRFNVQEELTVAQPNSIVHAIERLATQAWFARTLLFIAFFALITEASSPGVGVAGFVSGLCFLLFFWCQFLNGTAGWLEMMLFLGGLTCVALEIFVLPGFGVFGMGGAVMVLASIVLASQTFVWPRNTYQVEQVSRSLTTMVVACAGVISALWLMRKLLAESWLFRRLMLIPPSQEVDLDRLESIVDWRYLLGKRGVATTQLTPSGKARFGDDVVNVISDGILVPKDTPVHVVEVRGNRVQVEPLEES
jgi:membrane-bound ClpP family serine protease